MDESSKKVAHKRTSNPHFQTKVRDFRLPIALFVMVLTAFMIFFSVSQYRERAGNLRQHVQIQIDGVVSLAAITKKSNPLTPADMWDSVRGFPDISEALITNESGEVIGHFINPGLRSAWPTLPKSWQFMKVRSNPIRSALSADTLTVVINLSRLHFSLLSVLMGIVGFSAILLIGATRFTKSTNEHARAMKGEMDSLTTIDTLTGLQNRLGLENALEDAKSNFDGNGVLFALLLVDLDNFKITNDTWGYQTGDQVIIQVASRIKKNLREQDFLARMGADEFAIILKNFTSDADLSLIARQLISSISEPLEISGSAITVGASIGLAQVPVGKADVDALKAYAEAALYQAKKNGKNTYHVFSNDLAHSFHERVALHAMMRQAIKNKEFFMVYQPILDLRTLRITSFEALARWRHPEKGLIMPGIFMPIAEETGMIVEIGEIALQEACADFNWLGTRMDTKDLSVAVNLSIHQFKRRQSTENLHAIVLRSSVDLGKIQFEVTESTMMESVQSSAEDLDQLMEMGYSLSIDDFGTGYSSLSRLKEVDVKKLKIDRSFITNIDKDEANRAIVTAVVQMAHSLGMRVVAEGVETEAEARVVRALECDELQGFLVSRPLPMSEIQSLLANYTIIEQTFQISPEMSS